MQDIFEVAIVGGGITGLGVALEAAKWGFSSLLLEKNKICQETSANSLRIIHGGFRYLQNLDIARTRESIRARNELLREYPEFIRPLPCLLGLKKWGLKSKAPAFIANKLYRLLSFDDANEIPKNQVLSSAEAEKLSPILFGQVPHGALLWWDAIINDVDGFARTLVAQTIKDGGKILENSEVKKIHFEKNEYLISVVSNGEEKIFRAKTLVNCAGPAVDKVDRLGNAQQKRRPNFCRAFNVVVKKTFDRSHGLAFETKDEFAMKRLFFVTPRNEGLSAVGTGYLASDSENPIANISEEELANFLTLFNKALPSANIRLDEVSSIEVGLLPLQGIQSQPNQLLPHPKLIQNKSYISVVSTKYTIFKPQGRKVFKRISKYLS